MRTLLIGMASVLILSSASLGQQPKPKPIPMSVYKSPACGCCSLWVDYMRKNGFDPKVQDVDNIGALKLKLGVREEFSSCHTTEVGGYIVEGHVPVEVVQRMLKERPKIAGIAVPGCPRDCRAWKCRAAARSRTTFSRSPATARRRSTSAAERSPQSLR